jgi:hypothetical protein
MEEQYPNDLSLQQVLVEHRKTYSRPSIRYVDQTVLKEGPRSLKVATMFEVVNHHTGELHHYSLKLESARRSKATGLQFSGRNSYLLNKTG